MFDRAIPSCSTHNVLAQYLRRILTELLRQEENGFESGYVLFRLEQLIDVLLRAETICPQSAQLVSILRKTSTTNSMLRGYLLFSFFIYVFYICEAEPAQFAAMFKMVLSEPAAPVFAGAKKSLPCFQE